MGASRYAQRTFCRETVIVIVISLAAQFAFGGLAGLSITNPDPRFAQLSNSLPSKIIATDGVTYNAVKLSSIEPDGLVVEFRPVTGGTGLARLKFAKLPESLQNLFGYDPRKASAYEQEQGVVMSTLSQKLRRDEMMRRAISTVMTQPNVARFVVVKSSAPTVTCVYYDSLGPRPEVLDSNDVRSAQHKFKCDSAFEFSTRQDAAGKPMIFHVESATITLGLSTTITQPVRPGEKGRLHGEGHRKIYEHYYYLVGPKEARKYGEFMIGSEFTSRAADIETAKADAQSQAANRVEKIYLPRLDYIVGAANQYYDQITDHGWNNVDTDLALQATFAKFGENF